MPPTSWPICTTIYTSIAFLRPSLNPAHPHIFILYTENIETQPYQSCQGANSQSMRKNWKFIIGPRQANLVLIAYASSEGSGEPAHPRSLARTFAARSYKQWVKRNLQTESQILSPSKWLGMCSWNLSWRNARRHKIAWRGSIYA